MTDAERRIFRAERLGTAANHSASGCCGCAALHFADGVSPAAVAARVSETVDRTALLLRLAGAKAVGKGPNMLGSGRPRGPARRPG